MVKPIIIARIKGGLGNQLFAYAAARRLSLKNNVPLKLDVTSSYKGEQVIWRKYDCLSRFNIKVDRVTPKESFDYLPIRILRILYRQIDKYVKFENRIFLMEEFPNFDERLLKLKVNRRLYLDGYWQSEKYFKDVEKTIKKDLEFTTEHDPLNLKISEDIRDTNSVCLHARRLTFVSADSKPVPLSNSLGMDYYQKAINTVIRKVNRPHFYCFADYPEWLYENIKLDCKVTFVTNNRGNEKNYEDLWLMSQCKHFIIADSSFSWWAAWLSQYPYKMVIAPSNALCSKNDSIADGWIKINT